MSYPIEPVQVVDLVERYVAEQRLDVEKFENRSLLDDSGVFSLHLLAAEVYALAWDDATRAAEARRIGR